MNISPNNTGSVRAHSTTTSSDQASSSTDRRGQSSDSRPVIRSQTAALRKRIATHRQAEQTEQQGEAAGPSHAAPAPVPAPAPTTFQDLAPDVHEMVVRKCGLEEIKLLRQVSKELCRMASATVSNVRLDENRISQAVTAFKNTSSIDLIDDAVVGGEALANLMSLPALKKVRIHVPRVLHNDDLQHLIPLANTLQELTLSNCRTLSDAGIVRLVEMVNLERLWIQNCRLITNAGKNTLQAALPNLQIIT